MPFCTLVFHRYDANGILTTRNLRKIYNPRPIAYDDAMSLQKEIAEWDNRSADTIAATYARYVCDEEFFVQVVKLMGEVSLQRATTWLIKHHLEKTTVLPKTNLAEEIYGHVDALVHWETKLHILQIMSYLPVPEKRLPKVEEFVGECLVSERKFVRAWAYSGFYQLAAQYPQFRLEQVKLFEFAAENETAGSVKSRIRQLVK